MNSKKICALIFGIIGISAGIFIIIYGVFFVDCYMCAYTDSSIAFGADFYTEVYQATAHAANNICTVNNTIEECVRAILVVIGVVDICYFAFKTAVCISEPSGEKKLVVSDNVSVQNYQCAEFSEKKPVENDNVQSVDSDNESE